MEDNRAKSPDEVYEALIHVALFQHPFEEIRPHIDDTFMGYGTAPDEKLTGWEGFHWMVARQREELNAAKVTITRFPVQKSLIAENRLALVVEELEFSIDTAEGAHGFTMRLTTILEQKEGRWMVRHFHGSTADADTPEGNAWPIEEWKRRNAELQQIVEEKTADLQEKNRELEIEAALERVRARTMAMQHSDELPMVAHLLFSQIRELGIPAWSAGYNILSGDKRTTTCIMSSEGQIQSAFQLPLLGESSFAEWHRAVTGPDAFFVQELGGRELEEHYTYLMSLPGVKESVEPLEQAGISLPTYQVNHLSFFTHGFLLFITYEKVPDAHDIFKRFTHIFDQTYTRFLDLKQAEEQELLIRQEKERLEKALNELREAQAQLIHAEKMASLGELTAGIAHEIKNPLNFINNFSDVSQEMLDEMIEEINAGEQEEAFELIDQIKTNLRRIVEHGKRADSIVNGMLMHSRGDSQGRELTDINALCDEYLRLAYHGLRARDKAFNAEMKTDFDTSLPKVNIAPQEIGRVLLNLITNAFHAVTEKKTDHADPEYGPLVTIKTAMSGHSVQINVMDNGKGIPEKIRNKIFQPFFTTKPTGSGTGLGLSISYDIVKAHGGEIIVHSIEGEGTVFQIRLPL